MKSRAAILVVASLPLLLVACGTPRSKSTAPAHDAAVATGGSVTGGNAAEASAAGGMVTGGNAAGASAAGGMATGGSATGASATGGVGTGGSATGGRATGGVAAGGTSTGGVATGGTSTGGVRSGGAGAGGTATGGVGTGGVADGGSAAGVTATGGSSGGTGGTMGDGNTPGAVTKQGGVVFTSAGGWFEYAFAEWNSLAGASAYNAYYKLDTAADTAYTKIDAELVRGTRMDVPGLLGKRSYDLKVVPVAGGAEDPTKASVVRVATKAHDRSGFAFDKRSPLGANGTTGGYNPDGTVNPAAAILYVTEANKDTIQLAVTKGNSTTTFTGIVAIQNGRTSAKSKVPLIVRFMGTVTAPAGLADDPLKQMQLKDNSNVTYEGIGTDAQLNGWGMDFQRCTNIEVRNLSWKDQPEDQLSFQSDCINLWIHNNDHFLGSCPNCADADKLYGDGSLDIKSGSTWISVSYDYYHGTEKTQGVGFGTDTTALVMTYHHNLYDVCHSRMPRISYVSMHVYNSYIKEAQTYAIAAAHGCSAFVQNNYFENSKRPMIIASQGHDLNGSDSTLSHNPGGTIKSQGNFMDDFTSDPSRFDPAVDTSLGPAVSGGAVYNNFDADFGTNYPQALDTPDEAKANVLRYSGRIRPSPNNLTAQ